MGYSNHGNSMWILQRELKILGRRLSYWSKNMIGNVYQKVEEWEEAVQMLEDLDITVNTEQSRENLNKAQTEYVRWMAMQESLLKQKSQVIISTIIMSSKKRGEG